MKGLVNHGGSPWAPLKGVIYKDVPCGLYGPRDYMAHYSAPVTALRAPSPSIQLASQPASQPASSLCSFLDFESIQKWHQKGSNSIMQKYYNFCPQYLNKIRVQERKEFE